MGSLRAPTKQIKSLLSRLLGWLGLALLAIYVFGVIDGMHMHLVLVPMQS